MHQKASFQLEKDEKDPDVLKDQLHVAPEVGCEMGERLAFLEEIIED